jgi:hypothetical protein
MLQEHTLLNTFQHVTLRTWGGGGGGGGGGGVVVKALCCKSEGRGFLTRLGEQIFSIYPILSAALGPGVYSASNRNEY